MEASPELISARVAKINSQITGKVFTKNAPNLIARECLLDALQALYDECSIETLQKCDKHVSQFFERFKTTVQEVKRLRVNASDFDIRSVIGRGHFGEVHVVKEKQSGDIYAMKTIRKSDSLEKTSFDVERDIMAYSTSPWLTSLQYAFQDTTCLFFIMEYHPGGDLLGLLYRQGGTLPESAATFYIAELMLALEDLHGMGYVHRDIKPDNVLLDRCGHLKLADFGSAARLNAKGFVDKGPPVGTPDYVAPEVLQSVENTKGKHSGYGVSCDFWSLGVLAFELTVGKTPFASQSTSTTYARIMNYSNNLKFPPDTLLTQAFVSFVKSLVTDAKSRPTIHQIKEHPLFKHHNFDNIREQVPPYVPKITSPEDTANFSDVLPKKSGPSMENFKRKFQFSGRNLPFIGFTFTHDLGCERRLGEVIGRDEIVKKLKEEVGELRKNIALTEDVEMAKMELEKKLHTKTRRLENIESIRDQLEKELAATMAERTALQRTLMMERKDRTELERKALDLIKSAKAKWEMSERTKVEALNLELEQRNDKITQLMTTNKMLNEQLELALKTEEKHRKSIEAVEILSRRSVIGLESRLDKVTQDNRNTISYLQTQLNEELNQKHDLEKDLDNSRNKEKLLLEKLKTSDESYNNLKAKVDEAEIVIRTLNEKVDEMEDYMRNLINSQSEVAGLKTSIENRDANLRDLEKTISLLQSENSVLQKYKSDVEELTKVMTRNEKKIAELESKLIEEKEKCDSLKKNLENSENLANETQELRELRTKLWRVEKDFGNCKIDKRILERELKDAETRIGQLNDEIVKLNEKIADDRTIHESAMLELSSFNETLSLEVVKAKESCKSLVERLANEKEKYEEDKSTIAELKEVIRGKERKIDEVTAEVDVLKKEKAALEGRMGAVEKEKAALVDERNQSRQEAQKAGQELDNAIRQIENTQLNWEALREACTLLEGQVIEYEKITASVQAEKKQLSENTEKLINDLCESKRETQQARKLTNEEKSLRLLAESKVKRLDERIENLKIERNAIESELSEFKRCSNDLSSELAIAEEKISELEVTANSYQRQIKVLEADVASLKEEISKCLTQLGGFRDANRSLKNQLNEQKEINQVVMSCNDDLQKKLCDEITAKQERELKATSTIQQQTKLIYYLQFKVDELSQKKRSFAEKIFGHSKKENQPPPPLPLAANYKDFDVQLRKQMHINRLLTDEVKALKAEINAKASGNANNKVNRHKSEIISPKVNVASRVVRRSSTKIPAPKPPQETVTVAQVHQCQPSVEGWVKVLSQRTWELRYASLNATRFNIRTSPEKDRGVLVESVDLRPPNSDGRVLLEPLPSEIEGPVISTELPFVMKIVVTPDDSSLPPSSIVFMALSAADRAKWFRGLQLIFGEDPNIEVITNVPVNIRVNCLTELTKTIKVVGADCGLYYCDNKKLSRLEGVSRVVRCAVVPSANKVVMIAGDDASLIVCDLNCLLNVTQCASLTRAKLICDDLNVLDGFQFLEVSRVAKHEFFCAATPKQLVIFKYDPENGDFVPLRVMDTAQPISCALFTQHSLIVGANKLFEVDLNGFQAEEFLDSSDNNLVAAVKCGEIESFPLGVEQVGDYPKEFLVCFKELTVIVDEYGRFSRESRIDCSYVPVAFKYVDPFLYIVHLNGVEVLKFSETMNNRANVDLKHARYVGESRKGIYVLHDGKVKLVEGRTVVEVDGDTSIVSEATDNDSDRFSFTSSIVRSLDGNLSDSESVNTEEGAARKVTFAQTNL